MQNGYYLSNKKNRLGIYPDEPYEKYPTVLLYVNWHVHGHIYRCRYRG